MGWFVLLHFQSAGAGAACKNIFVSRLEKRHTLPSLAWYALVCMSNWWRLIFLCIEIFTDTKVIVPDISIRVGLMKLAPNAALEYLSQPSWNHTNARFIQLRPLPYHLFRSPKKSGAVRVTVIIDCQCLFYFWADMTGNVPTLKMLVGNVRSIRNCLDSRKTANRPDYYAVSMT